MNRRFALAAVVVICLIVAIGEAFRTYSADAYAQWWITIGGTILGAGIAAYFALEFFRYQLGVHDDKRREELLKALVAELYATRDRMKTSPAQAVPDPTGNEPDVSVVVAHLEPTACEEAIRTALFNPESASSLTYLSRTVHEYTKIADILRLSLLGWPIYDSPMMEVRTHNLAKNVWKQQLFVIHWCDTILDDLKKQGLDMPPDEKYYSDPSREAPEDFFAPSILTRHRTAQGY